MGRTFCRRLPPWQKESRKRAKSSPSRASTSTTLARCTFSLPSAQVEQLTAARALRRNLKSVEHTTRTATPAVGLYARRPAKPAISRAGSAEGVNNRFAGGTHQHTSGFPSGPDRRFERRPGLTPWTSVAVHDLQSPRDAKAAQGSGRGRTLMISTLECCDDVDHRRSRCRRSAPLSPVRGFTSRIQRPRSRIN